MVNTTDDFFYLRVPEVTLKDQKAWKLYEYSIKKDNELNSNNNNEQKHSKSPSPYYVENFANLQMLLSLNEQEDSEAERLIMKNPNLITEL